MAHAAMDVSGDSAREREVEKQTPVVGRDGGGQGQTQAEAAGDHLPPPGATDGGDEEDGRCSQQSTAVERADAVEERPRAETPDHGSERGRCESWTSPPESAPHDSINVSAWPTERRLDTGRRAVSSGPLCRSTRLLYPRNGATDSEECGSEEELGPREDGQLVLHCGANRLPGTAHDPLVDRAEGPRKRDPELRQPPRRFVGSLEIEHDPAPTRGEGRRAVGDDVCAFRHVRQGVGGNDRVDLGWKVELGSVGLYEADIAEVVRLYSMPGLVEHRVGQIDADDPAAGTDRLLDQREVQPGAAGDVDHAVARAEPECLDSPEALGLLGVAGHGVEPRGDVVVLRLPAVGLDQTLSRTVDLGHGALRCLALSRVADSTAALIAAISMSMTRRILPSRTRAGIARMTFLRSTSTHIIASVCRSSSGSSSIPQRAAEVPIGPANATRPGASTAVTRWARERVDPSIPFARCCSREPG